LPIKGDYIHLANLPEEVFVENTFDAAPLSTYGREVSAKSSDTSVATVENGVVTFVKAGTVTITFTTQGDAFCAGATHAVTFAPSDFSPVIASVEDMQKLVQNPSANFVLTADIDMAGVEFTPISNFSGTFDGQGHWIRNLSFNNKDRDRTAFIAEFSGAFIKNVGFDGVNFVGNADVAAVVGETKADGVISNVVVTNSYLEGRDHVASICGKLNEGATIVNCISNAEIKTRSYQAAGIVGVGIKGTVDKCIFAGTVSTTGGNTNLSGIVSLLDDNNVTIKNCLAAAASYTHANTGSSCGLIVNAYSREVALENNYVAAYSMVDGLAATGSTADSMQGAIASTEDVRSKAWYTNTLGLDFDNDWQYLEGGDGNMLPVLKWMKAPVVTTIFNMPSADGINMTYYEGNEFWDCAVLLGSWGQSVMVEQLSGEQYACYVPEENYIYAGDEVGSLPNGGGTATFKVTFGTALDGLFSLAGRDTFEVNVSLSNEQKTIKTVEEFLNIRKNPAGTYTLGADIDLAGVEFNGFCNDGNSAFTGTLDGAGHTVKNFNLSFTADTNHGLFGKTSGATIKNIAFTQFSIKGISGVNHVGLIGQAASTTLENVAIVGEVAGDDHVGLVAGDADGVEMLNCYGVGTVVGGSQVGGYFGCTLEGGCVIENCLSNINAEATFRGWVGGFIGLIDKSNSAVTIKNSVSIGNCKAYGNGSPKVCAPFIAGNGAGDEANAVVTFSGNIYNSAATMEGERTDWPTKNETAEGGMVEAATAQNPNTLTAQSTYTAIGWDFDNVWSMGEGEYKYPVLATVKVTDFSVSGIEDVISGVTESSVVVYGAEGEILVSGLGETAAITVYTAAGVQVASAVVNGAQATVAVPANGFYIVSVATNGTVKTAKVVVK
ncbi:MAG: T9SS type A sorting domain-containing protein, partial [Roseburia sp.]|nr:T9SS type A sorting domain-containing protein [Roseburia sp.]